MQSLRGLARQLVKDLAVLWEASHLMLGEDQLAVGEDIELAAAARLYLNLKTALLPDGGCETRSPGLVVSHLAVFDIDTHAQIMAPKGRGRKCAANPELGNSAGPGTTFPGRRRAVACGQARISRSGAR